MRVKTLLVAVLPEDRDQVPAIAANEFQVHIASSIKEAMGMLKSKDVEGVVCGVHFNEGDLSQFFDALRACPKAAALPFIVVKGAEGRLNAASYRAAQLACEQKGIPYFDVTDLVRRLGTEPGYAELRRKIRELLQPK